MCEDDTHNKGKSVRKSNCVACTPSRICPPHGYATCNLGKPGIADRNNLTCRLKKERKKICNHTAAEFLALTEEKQSELPLDFMYLRDKLAVAACANS
jgi:hypothetical protein